MPALPIQAPDPLAVSLGGSETAGLQLAAYWSDRASVGAAGIALALEFAGSHHRVLLAESGGLDAADGMLA